MTMSVQSAITRLLGGVSYINEQNMVLIGALLTGSL